MLEFGSAMAGYAVLMMLAVLFVPRYPAWRIPLALAPSVPLWLALWAALRFFRRQDEFGRRIQFEAIGVAFVGGIMITMTYGLLETLAEFPRLSWTWVPPVFLFLWGIGGAIAHRRYR
jgi:hypothetical protein